jgi:hypothetical protein
VAAVREVWRVSRASRCLIGVVAALVAAATVAPVDVPLADAADAAPAAFNAVRPCRLADTRGGTGFTRVDAATIRISVAGRCGVPGGSSAATLTVTITEAQAPGFATIYPTGTARPLTTAGNVRAGETRATSTIARLGNGGSIDIYLAMTAHVVVDVTGGFVPALTSTAGRFMPFGPLRLADTRLTGKRVTAGGRLDVPLPAGVPTDTIALAVNVTITGTSGAGFATAFAATDGTPPPTSTVNSDGPNQTRSATVIVSAATSGIAVYANSATDVVVDVFGYFTGTSGGASSTGLFTAVDPQRVLDTRERSPLGTNVPLYPNGGLELQLPGDSAIAAYMIAAVDAEPGYLTTFPAGTARPGTATATMSVQGEVVANLAFSQRSTRGLSVFSHAQSHVVIDLAGWFSGIIRTASQPPPTNTPPATAAGPPPPQPPPATNTPVPTEYLPMGEQGCTAYIKIAAPTADAVTIGTSVQGRPIIAEHYGDPQGQPVLVVGPPHGDECSALAVVERVRALGRDGKVPPDLHLVVIPTINPDGIIMGARRNANGVDLNKDGADWSQPETQALMNLTAELKPVASIHLHSPLSMVGGQSGPFGLGAFMAAHIAERTGIHLTRSAGSQAHFLWGGQAQVMPYMASVLVETPRGYPAEAIGATGEVMAGPPPSDELWQVTAEAVLEAFSLV